MAYGFRWFDAAGNGPFEVTADTIEELETFAASGVGAQLDGSVIDTPRTNIVDLETGQPLETPEGSDEPVPGVVIPTDPDAEPVEPEAVGATGAAGPAETPADGQPADAVGVQEPAPADPAGSPVPGEETPGIQPDPAPGVAFPDFGEFEGDESGSDPSSGDQGSGSDESSTDGSSEPAPEAADTGAPTDVTPSPDELTEPPLTPAEEAAPTTGVQELSEADQAAPVAAEDPEADETAELETNEDDGPEDLVSAPGIGAPVNEDSPVEVATAEEPETPLEQQTAEETDIAPPPLPGIDPHPAPAAADSGV